MLALTALSACGGDGENDNPSGDGNTTDAPGGNNPGGGSQIVTDERIPGEESQAKLNYHAKSIRDEFTFGADGKLSSYKTVYTFEEGADKEDGLEFCLGMGFNAKIEGETLVVEYSVYLNKDLPDWSFDGVKAELDALGVTYSVK